MEIKDINANQGNIDIVAELVSKDEPRTFEKFGKSGRVCNAILKDATGEVKLTLWNDDIDTVNVGDKVHIQNGWCSEYKGEKQLSSGKFGKVEVVEQAGSRDVMTNDPGMLAPQTPQVAPEAGIQAAEPEVQSDDDTELIDDEEEVIF